MKSLAAAIVMGPLMLIGALPAAAQSNVTPGSDAPLQLMPGDSQADKDSFTQKVRDDMHAWQRKMDHFSAQTAAQGREADHTAEVDLKQAWAKTKVESHKLQAASAAGWQEAKISYQKASRDLADAWNKARPQDK